MMSVGGLGGVLLLLAAQPLLSAAPGNGSAAATTQVQFAPPVGRPITYRVTTRRVGREGALINFSLTYALQWQRVGRGYRLEAVLQRIDSDARPEVARALIAPANNAIPIAAQADGANVSIIHDGALQTIANVERDSAPVGGTARPLEIGNLWTVDTATGLVMREQRQSWIVEADGDGRTLVEERVRALEFVP